MLFRYAMIFVLVVWLNVGWVHANRGTPTLDDRGRKMHLKRRMLERMANRGYSIQESERLAAELLSRLESLSTSTPRYQASRHQRDHHRSLGRHIGHPGHEPSYPEMNPYDQLTVLQEEEEAVVVGSQFEKQSETEVSLELEARDMLRKYLTEEPLTLKTMERRHTAKETQQPEPTTRRRSREERRRQKEEKKRKKEEKKKKRSSKKNKKRRQEQEFENFLRNQSIPIEEVDGDKFFTCCPSKLLIVEKLIGKARDNLAMEINEQHQIFYERVCLEEYLGKECIFPSRSLKKGVVTRCAQEYSFSQALVRRYETDLPFMIDYVEVRSGCSCQASLTHKKRKRRKR